MYNYKKMNKKEFDKNVLQELKEILRNAYVENLSCEKVIDKYGREYSFFFCDPSYFEIAGYGNTFGENEHLILRDKLKNLKGKFLLTINDHEKVREWYKDFSIVETEVNYSFSKDTKGRGKYGELIITNY